MNSPSLDQLIGLAIQSHQGGRLAEARALYQRVIEQQPDHARALRLLGVLHCQSGRHEAGIDLITRALAIDGNAPQLHHDLGLAYGALGRYEEAVISFRRALERAPDFAEAHLSLGLALFNQGRLAEAGQCFQQALAIRPDLVPAHYNLGLILIRQDRLDEAADCYRNALALRPDLAEAHLNLGLVYSRQDRLDEAGDSYRAALALKPGLVLAHYNLGLALYNQGRLNEAADSYRKALALQPDHVETHLDLSLLYGDVGRVDESVACAREALAVDPRHAKAHLSLGIALLRQGRIDEAADCCRRALELDSGLVDAHSALLMVMQYSAAGAATEFLAEHRRFADRFETPLQPRRRPHANTRDPERRLRLGYVSADFCYHSVAFFFQPILAAHDRDSFEVACYSNSNQHDAMADRLQAGADRWVPCRGLTDEQLAERVRADAIDILVDLSGHTRGNRLLAFARRPAPVQVTYLGYPGTTGLEAMDYRLCTADTDPPGAEAWHSERLFRLPRSLWVYRPPVELAGDAGSAPAARSDTITFGSMNMLAKVSPQTFSLWAGILLRLPEARLAMTGIPEGDARTLIRQRFTAQGIAAERLELHGKLAYVDYRELLRRIDIALDPFPYNGTTTTCDTLWRGIPMVSLAGETSVARSGYALLKMVELEELVAPDEAAYVRIAVELARDADRLMALRAGLRARFEASPLRDEGGFTRELETAYRTMWREWCRR